MVIRPENALFAVALIERLPSGLPCAGDLLLAIDVQVAQFTARSQYWFAADQLELFSEQLTRLEQRRRGVATLHSLSIDDCELRFLMNRSRGPLAVMGHLAHRGQRLTFATDFDATDISVAVARWRDTMAVPTLPVH